MTVREKLLFSFLMEVKGRNFDCIAYFLFCASFYAILILVEFLYLQILLYSTTNIFLNHWLVSDYHCLWMTYSLK